LNLIANILLAALISSALVTPLVFLELHYASQDYSEFPYLLFAVLWLSPAAFVLTITPLVRAVRAGKRLLAHPGTCRAYRLSCTSRNAVDGRHPWPTTLFPRRSELRL